MNQNKILSLEEIEKWQKIYDEYGPNALAHAVREEGKDIAFKGLGDLLATARAYHEAVKGERQYSCCCKGFYPSSNGGCFNCGHDEDSHSGLIECCNKVDVEYREKHLASEDKPHAPTIKWLIQKLMNVEGISQKVISEDKCEEQPMLASDLRIELESILKEL